MEAAELRDLSSDLRSACEKKEKKSHCSGRRDKVKKYGHHKQPKRGTHHRVPPGSTRGHPQGWKGWSGTSACSAQSGPSDTPLRTPEGEAVRRNKGGGGERCLNGVVLQAERRERGSHIPLPLQSTRTGATAPCCPPARSLKEEEEKTSTTQAGARQKKTKEETEREGRGRRREKYRA